LSFTLVFGNASAELKTYIDSLGSLWFQGKLNGKAAGAFTSSAGPHGGNETTVVSLFIPMAHLGFIIVPTGYAHPKLLQGHGTPYGASSVLGQNSIPPTADDLEVAKHQGTRVTRVAAALKAAVAGTGVKQKGVRNGDPGATGTLPRSEPRSSRSEAIVAVLGAASMR
jgi:NAD(P)H dehydrogenase (quinone)